MKKISSLLPTPNIGYNLIIGGENTLQTIYDDLLCPISLLLSDEILIDNSWKTIYLDYNFTDSVEYKIFDTLISEKILKEINIKNYINEKEIEEMSQFTVKSLCLNWAQSNGVYLSENQINRINDDIFYAEYYLKKLKFDEEHLPYIYDSMIIYMLLGNEFFRIINAQDYFNFYSYCVLNSKRENFDKVNSNYERLYYWTIKMTEQTLPKIDLYLTQTHDPGRIITPLEKLGYKNPYLGKNKYKDIADELESRNQLDKIIKFRNSASVRSLRYEYKKILDIYKPTNELSTLPSLKKINNIWEEVSYECSEKFKYFNIFNKITDYLTIPCFLMGLTYPEISIPSVITWSACKITKVFADKYIRNKYPWFFLKSNINTMKGEYINKIDKI